MSRFKKAVISGLLTGILGLILIPFMCYLEETVGLDLLFKLRGAREVPADVVVVTLDKDSATHLNLPPEPYKWPRSFHARLINNLVSQGAAVIAFDMIFKEPGPVDIDRQFAQAINKAGNVVLCEQLDKDSVPLVDSRGAHSSTLEIESLVPLIPMLSRSAMATAPFPLPKIPVKVSQYWTFKTGAGDKPTFPVAAFQVYALDVYNDLIGLLNKVDTARVRKLPKNRDEAVAAKGIENLVQSLRGIFEKDPAIPRKLLATLQNHADVGGDPRKHRVLESLIMMYQGGDSHYLNYYGPPGTIYTIPYYQLIPSPEETPFKNKVVDLKGKAVFVGLSERLRPEEKDGFYTAYSQTSGVDISGVEIAATAFANLLENRHVRPFSLMAHIATILLAGLILGIFCRMFSTVVAAIGVIGMSTLYVVIAQYQFSLFGIWSPLVLPVFVQAPVAFIGTVLWKYIETHKERQNVRKALGYYVPRGVVEQMAKRVGDIRESRQVFSGTLLCTDAENYTTLSETLTPEALARVMNEYFEAVFGPVKTHKGIVSEVVADSMIAIWEAVGSETTHRTQACHAALGIAHAVNQFNQTHRDSRLPTRIGLHAGQMMVGNIGAMDRYEYNPIGDIVNTASRIESLNKQLGTRILASCEVVDGLAPFLTRDLGKFVFAGKSKPVAVCELICLKDEANEYQKQLSAVFAEVLDAYRNQSWGNGIKRLSDLLNLNGEDGPSRFYLELFRRNAESPVKERWNGFIHLDQK